MTNKLQGSIINLCHQFIIFDTTLWLPTPETLIPFNTSCGFSCINRSISDSEEAVDLVGSGMSCVSL